MYKFTEQRTDLSKAHLQQLALKFIGINSLKDLAQLLSVSTAQLQKLAEGQRYETFRIPKPGGRKRLIEHPEKDLKQVQQHLNRYLQAVYYHVMSKSAYGFILCPVDDSEPRNIYSNALKHMHAQWVYQIDLKDFFHQVSKARLLTLFEKEFKFSSEIAQLLALLTTKHQRLPMGAPTSPVLSNLVSLSLDAELYQLATQHHGIYTRYADDLTFSFQSTIPIDFEYFVDLILVQERFEVNLEKTRLLPITSNPEVTGLVLGNGKPTVSARWYKRLKKEMKAYQYLMSEGVQERGLFHKWTFDKLKQSITGQMEFLSFVLGQQAPEVRKLRGRLGWRV
jgi:RNA-directed DNA polymerase